MSYSSRESSNTCLAYHLAFCICSFALFFASVRNVSAQAFSEEKVLTNTAAADIDSASKEQDDRPLVIIDAGHGGRDPGAYYGNIAEKTLALDVALRIKDELEVLGYKVLMTRSVDKYLSLKQRVLIGNQNYDAILISVHFNAFYDKSVRGVETFYHHSSSQGYKLASCIQSEIVKTIKVTDRGCKKSQKLAVVSKTKCLSVLVEGGFMSNSWELERCTKGWYKALLARSIVIGIDKYCRPLLYVANPPS